MVCKMVCAQHAKTGPVLGATLASLTEHDNVCLFAVVMTRKPKLELEATFRRIIPDELRFGSTFVFRQGYVLVPGDLRKVAAAAAASIVIISDRSR